MSPRKAASPAPKTNVTPAAIAEQLRVALEPVDEPIGAKYERLSTLLDTLSKTPGVSFDDVVELARAIPRPAEIAAAYIEAAAAASIAEKERKRLSSAMLQYFDSPVGIQEGDELAVEGTEFIIAREFGQTPDKLSPQLLLQNGVDPEVIENSTEPGTPYFKVVVRKVKIAK